jgi:hypothetical protein
VAYFNKFLSLYLAERAGKRVDPAKSKLLRSYPETSLPLLPFAEHGKRFGHEEYVAYRAAGGNHN